MEAHRQIKTQMNNTEAHSVNLSLIMKSREKALQCIAFAL